MSIIPKARIELIERYFDGRISPTETTTPSLYWECIKYIEWLRWTFERNCDKDFTSYPGYSIPVLKKVPKKDIHIKILRLKGGI